MVSQKGFMFFDAMIGCTILLFFGTITAHYIVQLKNIQQDCLSSLRLFLITRNALEYSYAHQNAQSGKTEHEVKSVLVNKGSMYRNGKKLFLESYIITTTLTTPRKKEMTEQYTFYLEKNE